MRLTSSSSSHNEHFDGALDWVWLALVNWTAPSLGVSIPKTDEATPVDEAWSSMACENTKQRFESFRVELLTILAI